MGFDINKIGVISVRPMAISNELQVHGFIWLCIGRYFTFRICLDASLRRFGFAPLGLHCGSMRFVVCGVGGWDPWPFVATVFAALPRELPIYQMRCLFFCFLW